MSENQQIAESTPPPAVKSSAARVAAEKVRLEKAQAETTRKRPVANRTKAEISGDVRHAMIARAAYYRAEARGFAAGSDLDDWIAAENEIDRLLKS